MSKFFEFPNYSYRAKLINIVDGDTIDVELDLGFDTTVRKRLRFIGIDAWEPRGEERDKGLAATARLTELLEAADSLVVQTKMDSEGKYGRVLAYVWALDEFANATHVNFVLLEEGHAKPYGNAITG